MMLLIEALDFFLFLGDLFFIFINLLLQLAFLDHFLSLFLASDSSFTSTSLILLLDKSQDVVLVSHWILIIFDRFFESTFKLSTQDCPKLTLIRWFVKVSFPPTTFFYIFHSRVATIFNIPFPVTPRITSQFHRSVDPLCFLSAFLFLILLRQDLVNFWILGFTDRLRFNSFLLSCSGFLFIRFRLSCLL